MSKMHVSEAERTFLRQRLAAAEDRRRAICSTLTQEHPDLREAVLARCLSPLTETTSADGLPPGADASLVRFKREEEMLHWLEDGLEEADLTALLWHAMTLYSREALGEAAIGGHAYSDWYWHLHQEAETLRLLWNKWREQWRAARGGGEEAMQGGA